MDKSGKLNKKTLIILASLFIVILVVIFVIILCINNGIGKNESKDIEETTTLEVEEPTSYYNGYILSANEEWIAEYTDGNITACVNNHDKSGIYDDNIDYACSTGMDCCSGDMNTEYNFPGGTAFGGGLDATGMMA